jgi:hypothetical protein
MPYVYDDEQNLKYVLTERQRLQFTDRVDIYQPSTPFTDPVTGQTGAPTFPITPTYYDVPCWFDPTPETEEIKTQGRNKVVNMFTLDKIRFNVEQPIADAWGIVIRTPGHPEYGTFYVVQGNPLNRFASSPVRDSNFAFVYVKHGTKPKGMI